MLFDGRVPIIYKYIYIVETKTSFLYEYIPHLMVMVPM